MDIEGPNSDKEKNLTRRSFLRWGLVGAGAILATTVTYSAINQFQTPEFSSERSSEFNKTPDWQQNFAELQTNTLDTSIWHYETSPDIPGYNDEAQAYTNWRENVRIEEGLGCSPFFSVDSEIDTSEKKDIHMSLPAQQKRTAI